MTLDTSGVDLTIEPKTSTDVKFVCPACGIVAQDDVIFLCNTCKQEDLLFKDGLYMCPSCLLPGENFECMLCGSKEVKMVKKKS